MNTRASIIARLTARWSVNRIIKIDWLAYEDLIDAIYHSDLSESERSLASMEALDAFTRRGHFDAKSYLTAMEVSK